MENKEKIELDLIFEKIEDVNTDLDERQRLIDQLAKECIERGQHFDDQPLLLQQNADMDRKMLSLSLLQNMLDELEKKEAQEKEESAKEETEKPSESENI